MISSERDWERTLGQTTFDLPEARWQTLENDLRAWLAQEARSPKKAPSVWDRLRQWSHRWGLATATGAAFAALALGVWIWNGPVRNSSSQTFAWAQGQVLDVPGRADWNWVDARTRIEADNARMVLSQHTQGTVGIRLERGQATFRVDHRRPDEAFTIDMGECRVRVVGTTFTVGMDSANSWVAVEEGRIRLERGAYSRLVEAGNRSVCRIPGTGARLDSAIPQTSKPALAEPAKPPSATASAAGPVSAAVQVPSCHEGADCIRSLSQFVRTYPAHQAVAEVALRWARLSAKAGDPRDALVAYGIAGNSAALTGIARMESLRLRSEKLSQDQAVADSLDAWLPALTAGSALWREGWTLRGDVARKTGDAVAAEIARTKLATSSTAEGGK